jgi:hypothetical protein
MWCLEEEFSLTRGASMSYRVYAPTLATALLVGTIGTALAQTTTVGTGAGAQTFIPGTAIIPGTGATTAAITAGARPPNATAGASPSFTPFFWNDPLSVGPTQIPPTGPVGSDPLSVGPTRIPPTGPVGSDPLRVGPTQVSGHGGSAASGSSATSLNNCGFPNCVPGDF